MLTEYQVVLLMEFSSAVAGGLFLGSITATLVSFTLTLFSRKDGDRRSGQSEIIIGISGGTLACVALAIVATVISVVVFPLGFKEVREMPIWYFNLTLVMLLVVAAMGVVMCQRRWAWLESMSAKSRLVWRWIAVVAGSVLGGVATVFSGFGGYFVVQSNAGPIRAALIGAFAGGTAAFCLATALFCREGGTKGEGGKGSEKAPVKTGME